MPRLHAVHGWLESLLGPKLPFIGKMHEVLHKMIVLIQYRRIFPHSSRSVT
jgi:hypothetical protein